MGTRSLIARQESDNKIKFVYCHWDGYLDGVGATLKEHYKDIELDELFKNGDVSSLGETPKENVNGWELGNNDYSMTRYYKTRGETNIDARTVKTPIDLLETGYGCGAEYAYLYKNGEWLYADVPWDGLDCLNEKKFEELFKKF